MNSLDAVVLAQDLTVPDDSWLGNMGPGGFGVLLLVFGFVCAKKEKLLWSPKFAEKVPWTWDWKSTLSFIVGFAGVTAFLATPGFIGDALRGIQGFISNLGNIEWISNIGIGVLCIFILLKVYTDQHDSVKDMRWGCLTAVIFPLGGGFFTESTIWMTEILQSVLNGGSA